MATTLASAFVFMMENLLDSDEELETATDFAFTASSCVLKRECIPKVQNFADTVESFTDYDFKKHFRIAKSTFDIVLDKVNPFLPQTEITESSETQLQIFLWYLSNQCSMREISNLFCISISTVHACISRVASALCDIRNLIIRWPSQQRQQDIAASFAAKSGMEGICGAIDGTHIRLHGAPGSERDFYNRKGFPSVQLQVYLPTLAIYITAI